MGEEGVTHTTTDLRRFEFSLQYPKPLQDEAIANIESLARSGEFSRYTSTAAEELEAALADFFGVKYAVTCSSGTASIHAALIGLDLPPGSEVITTPVTDVGVILPIIYQNLIPVFADLDPTTFNLDPESVEQSITSNTSAIIAVHLAGNPADLDALKAIADEHGIALIEDCSQAHGAEWHGRRCGSIGTLGLASLQQSKHLTSGEGGVVLTNDADMYERLILTVDKGWTRHLDLAHRRYEFLSLNYRYTGIQAAFVLPQMAHIDELLEKKRGLANYLRRRVESLAPTIMPSRVLEGANPSYYSFPMYTTRDQGFRDRLLRVMDEEFQVKCASGYANPLPLYLCVAALEDPKGQGRGFAYSDQSYPPGLCPKAEDLLSRSFLIPFNEGFSIDDMGEIMDRLERAIDTVS
jgi:perosamine synthetase